jgi:hypothetical protein
MHVVRLGQELTEDALAYALGEFDGPAAGVVLHVAPGAAELRAKRILCSTNPTSGEAEGDLNGACGLEVDMSLTDGDWELRR